MLYVDITFFYVKLFIHGLNFSKTAKSNKVVAVTKKYIDHDFSKT